MSTSYPGRLSTEEEEMLQRLRDNLRDSMGPQRTEALNEIRNVTGSLEAFNNTLAQPQGCSRQSGRPLDATSYYKSTVLTDIPPPEVLTAKPTSDEMKKYLSTQIMRKCDEYWAREAPLQPKIDFEADNIISCIGHEIRSDVPPIERERRMLTKRYAGSF